MKIGKVLFLMGGLMSSHLQAALISHEGDGFDLEATRARIGAQENPLLPINDQLILLDQLMEFELGRFLLNNRGLNGEWTSYVILHGPKKDGLPALERWFLHGAPVVLATRERFGIFQRETQKRLRDGMVLASVPCGLMEDLMTLNFKGHETIQLVGLDLDEASLEKARTVEQKLRAEGQLPEGVSADFEKADAWGLGKEGVFDLLTSNGLNIYEKDDARVAALYKEFYTALKPKGTLIMSFLTPPPMVDSRSPWKMDQLNPADLSKQKVLMTDIIGAQWTCFRSAELTRQQLTEAGFKNIQIIYDSRGMFPTMIAEK